MAGSHQRGAVEGLLSVVMILFRSYSLTHLTEIAIPFSPWG